MQEYAPELNSKKTNAQMEQPDLNTIGILLFVSIESQK